MQHILVCDDEEDIVAALKIYLEETQNEIDEVVVIGYGTVKKSERIR